MSSRSRRRSFSVFFPRWSRTRSQRITWNRSSRQSFLVFCKEGSRTWSQRMTWYLSSRQSPQYFDLSGAAASLFVSGSCRSWMFWFYRSLSQSDWKAQLLQNPYFLFKITQKTISKTLTIFKLFGDLCRQLSRHPDFDLAETTVEMTFWILPSGCCD